MKSRCPLAPVVPSIAIFNEVNVGNRHAVEGERTKVVEQCLADVEHVVRRRVGRLLDVQVEHLGIKRIVRRGEVQREGVVDVEVLVGLVGGQVHPGDLADDVIVLVGRDVAAGDVRDGQRARLVVIRRARHFEHVVVVGNGAAGAAAVAIRKQF